jgi:hypothetical protein
MVVLRVSLAHTISEKGHSRRSERHFRLSLKSGGIADIVALHHLNQERWASGSRSDLEQDDGESGIADQDGLDEQVPFRDWMMVGMV